MKIAPHAGLSSTNNYNSSTWSYSDYGNGNYPNLPLEDNPVNIWTTYHSAPYLLKNYIMNSYLTKKAIAEEYKRFIYFNEQDSISLIANLKRFSMDGKRLIFGQGLKTSFVTINRDASFNYQINLNSVRMVGNRKLMSFYFVGDGQKYLLDQVKLTGDEKDKVLNRSVTFDPGKATEGYVQIEFPQETPFVINVVPDNVTGLTKAATVATLRAFTPTTFRLNQNFPNPFNPTTQISFDLPQESKVTLEVFDINGHKVATLAKGSKPAGRYHVVFDANNLASGVYIYRLTTDKGFVRAKKMMLIR